MIEESTAIILSNEELKAFTGYHYTNGTFHIVLSEADIETMRLGRAIAQTINLGEYCVVIHIGEVRIQ